jgi:hypothetical protein
MFASQTGKVLYFSFDVDALHLMSFSKFEEKFEDGVRANGDVFQR